MEERELELERAQALAASREDRRLKLPEPPPVSLVSVRDVHLPAPPSTFRRLEEFYSGLLRFEPAGSAAGGGPVFRAENHELHLDVVEEGFRRPDCRPIGVFTPHLPEIVEELVAREIEFELVRGMVAGTDAVLLQDPAGNWLALALQREVR